MALYKYDDELMMIIIIIIKLNASVLFSHQQLTLPITSLILPVPCLPTDYFHVAELNYSMSRTQSHLRLFNNN